MDPIFFSQIKFSSQFLTFFVFLQVLGILQLDAPKTAHHVTQGDKIDKKTTEIDLCIAANKFREGILKNPPGEGGAFRRAQR